MWGGCGLQSGLHGQQQLQLLWLYSGICLHHLGNISSGEQWEPALTRGAVVDECCKAGVEKHWSAIISAALEAARTTNFHFQHARLQTRSASAALHFFLLAVYKALQVSSLFNGDTQIGLSCSSSPQRHPSHCKTNFSFNRFTLKTHTVCCITEWENAVLQ